jgi:hypothetical protein
LPPFVSQKYMNFCGQALLTQRLAAFYTFLTRVVLFSQQMLETMSGFGKRENDGM